LCSGIFGSLQRIWPLVTALSLCLLSTTASCNQADSQASGPATAQANSNSAQGDNPAAPDSGITGSMVAAWGNAPANPPTYECLKVFDASGQKLIATATCSGIWGQFRVALPPGRYVVEKGGRRKTVDVSPGQWVTMLPPSPPGPVP
jgi:hypothetical protein